MATDEQHDDRPKRATEARSGSVVLEMMLKFRNRRHVDRKKDADRKACRGRASDE